MSVSWQVSSALGTCCTQLDKEVLLCLHNNLLGDVTKHSEKVEWNILLSAIKGYTVMEHVLLTYT